MNDDKLNPNAAAPPAEAEPARRDFFRTAVVAGAGVAAVAGVMHGKYSLAPLIGEAHAQASPQAWWPSRWGKDDEAGASNLMSPAKVLDAAKWIRDGKVYRIGRVYEAGMPLLGPRAFALRIPGAPTGGPFGENKLVYNDDLLRRHVSPSPDVYIGRPPKSWPISLTRKSSL